MPAAPHRAKPASHHRPRLLAPCRSPPPPVVPLRAELASEHSSRHDAAKRSSHTSASRSWSPMPLANARARCSPTATARETSSPPRRSHHDATATTTRTTAAPLNPATSHHPTATVPASTCRVPPPPCRLAAANRHRAAFSHARASAAASSRYRCRRYRMGSACASIDRGFGPRPPPHHHAPPSLSPPASVVASSSSFPIAGHLLPPIRPSSVCAMRETGGDQCEASDPARSDPVAQAGEPTARPARA